MSEPYLGEIRPFAGNFAPLGWATCDGQLLQISENDALYMLMGTTYGGDGQTTFGVPDPRGRVPIHPANGQSFGASGGSETVTLTAQQMAAHTHPVAAQSTAGSQPGPANGVWAASGAFVYSANTPNAPMYPAAIGSSGGSQPHDNMMPFLTVTYIIALQGIYPSQS